MVIQLLQSLSLPLLAVECIVFAQFFQNLCRLFFRCPTGICFDVSDRSIELPFSNIALSWKYTVILKEQLTWVA